MEKFRLLFNCLVVILATLLIVPAPQSYAVTPYVPISVEHHQAGSLPADVHLARAKVSAKGGKTVSKPKAFATRGLRGATSVGNRIAADIGRAIRGPADVVHQVVKNAIEGRMRERLVKEELQRRYPNAVVQNQVNIVDRNGKRIIDHERTKTGRRLDHVVVENGKVIRIIETTSSTAVKFQQAQKENRIRSNDEPFIRDRKSGKLISISSVQTQTVRVDIKNVDLNFK